MGPAAVLIILFHLFPLSRGAGAVAKIIGFPVLTAYIGVDIFFFLSGYMMCFSDTDDYRGYLKRRLKRIYPLFIFSCLVFVVAGKLTPVKALLTLTGVDLFISGGGSFLWFLPAVIIVYILSPLYIRLKRKIGNLTQLFIGLALWTALMLLLEQYLTNHAANIFLCRIPIVLTGITMAEYEGRWQKKSGIIAGAILLLIGVALSWQFCYTAKVETPITNIFYVIAIPQCLGLILLIDAAAKAGKKSLLTFFGNITLELYCVQMMCGALLFGQVYTVIKNKIAAFIITFAIITLLSIILKQIGTILENRKNTIRN